ncbi:MAG: hypothetical protein JOZ62_03565 [Acidobacteriaceae bacterium]|nr:hypothetical protein [Acidobacteriaceae bacterium]
MSDARIKTARPSGEERDQFERHGERSLDIQRPTLDKVDSRQGVTGHNVRYVLLFGLLAVVIAFAATLLFAVYR